MPIKKEDLRGAIAVLANLIAGGADPRVLLQTALFDTERGDDLLNGLDLTGPPTDVAGRVALELERFGEVDPGKQALSLLLEVMSERVGLGDAAEIMEIIERNSLLTQSIESEPPSPNRDTPVERIRVTLTLDRKIADFSEREADNLVSYLARTIGVPSSEIRVLRIVEGSTRLVLEMSTLAAESLMRIFNGPRRQLLRDRHVLDVAFRKRVVLKPLQYDDLDIQIRAANGAGYTVAVLNSPAGQARSSLRLASADLNVEAWHRSLRTALAGPRQEHGETKESVKEAVEAIKKFGAVLFDALFVDDVRTRYYQSWQSCRMQHRGLRIKLRIEPPELAAVPWELLYDKDPAEYLCLSRYTPIVRYLDIGQPPGTLLVTPPLRVLAMTASPHDQQDLDVEAERDSIIRATEDLRYDGLIDITWLEGHTANALQDAFLQGSWHVFHFIGHGGFDTERREGYLALADENHRTRRLYAEELAVLLRHPSLRLVLLNACQSAKASQHDVFSGTASTLMRQGLPAVLAMQFPISDRAAITFAETFYKTIASGFPVDAAVGESRIAVRLASDHPMEWATPQLLMRAPDGVLFDVPKVDPSSGNAIPIAAVNVSVSPDPVHADAPIPKTELAAARPRPRRLWPIVAAGVVVAALGVVAFVSNRTTTEPPVTHLRLDLPGGPIRHDISGDVTDIEISRSPGPHRELSGIVLREDGTSPDASACTWRIARGGDWPILSDSCAFVVDDRPPVVLRFSLVGASQRQFTIKYTDP